MDVKIKKIEIQIGKETIKLSVEQAKELKCVLNEIYAETYTYYVDRPYPVYPTTAPYWTYTSGNSGRITL